MATANTTPHITSLDSASDIGEEAMSVVPIFDADAKAATKAKRAPGWDNAWVPYEHPLVMVKERDTGFWKKFLKFRWKYLAWKGPTCHPFGHRLSVWIVVMFLVMAALIAMAALSWNSEPGSSGKPAEISMMLVYLLVPHNSLVTLVLGEAFERLLRWHKYLGVLAIALSIYHGIQASHKDDEWSVADFDFTYLSGWISTLCMAFLGLFSFGFIRRHFFEWFFKIHVVMFIAAGVLAIVHGAGAVAAGFVLYVFDAVLRIYLVNHKSRPKTASLQVLPANVVRVSFPKGDFAYREGQYVFLCVPALTGLQYHPVSISSAPYEAEVKLHLRVLGDWTRKLHDLAGKQSTIKVHIDGPVGEPMVDIHGGHYKHFLLVSGGIGITPMQSIANMLIDQEQRGRPIEKLWFVWSVRDREILDAMVPVSEPGDQGTVAEELPQLFSPCLVSRYADSVVPEDPDHVPTDTNDYLNTEFYLTRRMSQHNMSHKRFPHLKFGRPDVAGICFRLSEIAKGAPVAVLCCGPDGMVRDVKEQCRQYPNFDLHHEKFDF